MHICDLFLNSIQIKCNNYRRCFSSCRSGLQTNNKLQKITQKSCNFVGEIKFKMASKQIIIHLPTEKKLGFSSYFLQINETKF